MIHVNWLVKRILLLVCCSSLLFGCALFQASPEDQFKRGDYIGGVRILANNMDKKSTRLKEKNKQLNDKDVAYLQKTVSNLMQMAQKNIDQAASTDYDKKIQNYKLLMEIKNQLEGKLFSPFIESQTNLFSMDQLKEKIAEQYYIHADSIAASVSGDYQRKAQLFHEGYQYFNYKDIYKRYQENQNLYYRTAAEEFYQQAQEDVRNNRYKDAVANFQKAYDVYLPLGSYKDSKKLVAVYEKKWRTIEAEEHYQQAQADVRNNQYKSAVANFQKAYDVYLPIGNYKDSKKLVAVYEKKWRTIDAEGYYQQAQADVRNNQYKSAVVNFQKAYNVYQPIGNYKDSKNLAAVYERKWRTIEAEDNYQQAESISRTATHLYEYRRASSLYSAADEVYRPYGGYKNARQLADGYYQKGLVNIFLDTDSFGNNYNIRSKLDKRFVRFVGSRAQANLFIRVKMHSDYKDYTEEVKVSNKSDTMQVGTEKVDDGTGNLVDKPVYKEFIFNEYSQKRINKVAIEGWLDIHGLYALERNYHKEYSSSETRYWFDEHAPKKYRAHTNGRLLSRDKLFDRAKDRVWSDISADILIFSNELDRL